MLFLVTEMLVKELVPAPTSNNTMSFIVSKLSENEDKKALVASSIMTFVDHVSGKHIGKHVDPEEIELTDEQLELRAASVLCPSMLSYLDATPKCKALLVKLRSLPHNDDKTPASLVHEYAMRSFMKIEYSMPDELGQGPFNVECILSSTNGETKFAVGKGEARTKKDAKQAAAAGAVEYLLGTVDPKEFMLNGRPRVRFSTSQYYLLAV
eukprot:g793.t1